MSHDFFNLLQKFFYIVLVLLDNNNFYLLIQVKIYSSSDNSDIGVPVSGHSGHVVCECECAVI